MDPHLSGQVHGHSGARAIAAEGQGGRLGEAHGVEQHSRFRRDPRAAFPRDAPKGPLGQGRPAVLGPHAKAIAPGADVDRLIAEEGYQTVDVVSMVPDHPEKAAFRQKFLEEHRHSEDEVRFFVEGQGLFTLHIGDRVYEVLCTKGDLISVPANTPHWFDMGPNPRFVAIRLFNNPEGWVANFTGSDIAQRFNRLEN